MKAVAERVVESSCLYLLNILNYWDLNILNYWKFCQLAGPGFHWKILSRGVISVKEFQAKHNSRVFHHSTWNVPTWCWNRGSEAKERNNGQSCLSFPEAKSWSILADQMELRDFWEMPISPWLQFCPTKSSEEKKSSPKVGFLFQSVFGEQWKSRIPFPLMRISGTIEANQVGQGQGWSQHVSLTERSEGKGRGGLWVLRLIRVKELGYVNRVWLGLNPEYVEIHRIWAWMQINESPKK